MIVITDVNKIFSAAFSIDGAEARIFSSKSKIQFFAPDYLLDELKLHFDEIAEGTRLSKKATKILLDSITSKIRSIKVADIPTTHIQKAIELVSDIDEKDAPYIALHLYSGHKLWTEIKNSFLG